MRGFVRIISICALLSAACSGHVSHAERHVDGAAGATSDDTDELCSAPSCTNPPSCSGLAATCGPNHDEGCCTARVVRGGSFYRIYDGIRDDLDLKIYPATVSDFALDTYEVTVGRFRAFAADYPISLPAGGAGKNAHNSADSGWIWRDSMPVDEHDLLVTLQCESRYQTWTRDDDALPINCLSWYEAEAFCIWDGGRLPTEAELNYAEAGGDQQREFPWGSAAPDATRAVFSETSNNEAAPVGSLPAGKGRFGHADLSGNVAEWVEDQVLFPRPTDDCVDCAYLDGGTNRAIRGGSFKDQASELSAAFTGERDPAPNSWLNGARCARNVP